jgi:hypothetical protein
VYAQDVKKKRARIQIEYFKDHNNLKSLVATLKVREDRFVPFENAEINFYSTADTLKVILSKVMTDKNGEAKYFLEDDLNIYLDSTGFMPFEVEYTGDDSIQSDISDIVIKPINLKTTFIKEDSIKYIAIEANEIDVENTNTPIEGLEISVNIKGTFSLLNIALEETDDQGKILVEFPVYMPGDTAGVITIAAQVQENDDYGTVETLEDINWGIPVPLKAEKHRGLGDTDAPLWMVYTLIILLSLVWFHYLYIVYLIVKIKLARHST